MVIFCQILLDKSDVRRSISPTVSTTTGSLNADIVVRGKQGHSAYPQLADNPVPKLARIIDRLSSAKLDDGTANFQPSNLQVTVISVPNTASNVIPADARATLNIRYNDNWTWP